jgi:hypothetical protein
MNTNNWWTRLLDRLDTLEVECADMERDEPRGSVDLVDGWRCLVTTYSGEIECST